MVVFRISLTKWAALTASGYPGRWNSKGKFMIYAATSRALASLENLVHRSGEGLNALFSTLVIQIPDHISITEIKVDMLSKDWYTYENHEKCQRIGDNWLNSGVSCILKVPSAIVKMESNFLINPRHSHFSQIKIGSIEKFEFDPRL